jgi:hypothetical protein
MDKDVGSAPTFRSLHLKFRKAAQPRRSLAKEGRKSIRNSFQQGVGGNFSINARDLGEAKTPRSIRVTKSYNPNFPLPTGTVTKDQTSSVSAGNQAVGVAICLLNVLAFIC